MVYRTQSKWHRKRVSDVTDHVDSGFQVDRKWPKPCSAKCVTACLTASGYIWSWLKYGWGNAKSSQDSNHYFIILIHHSSSCVYSLNSPSAGHGLSFLGSISKFQVGSYPGCMHSWWEQFRLPISSMNFAIWRLVFCGMFQALVSSNEHITKGKPYRFLKCWLGEGLLTATGKNKFTLSFTI